MAATNSKNICIFCSGEITGSKSREHIIPVWLLDELKIKQEIISPTHFSLEKGMKTVSTRHHDLNNLVARVCLDCNNGWMSILEAQAKPMLIELIRNEKVVIDFNEQERFIIARWAFKTALTLNLGSNFHKNVPLDHYKELYDNKHKLPERVYIVAQQHFCNRPFYWMQGSWWHILSKSLNKSKLSEIKEKSYKIGFQFGDLILLIGYNPFPELLFKIQANIHVPLYPVRGPIKYSVDDDFNFSDSEQAFNQFFFGLGLAETD